MKHKFKFRRGIHPPYNKVTASSEIEKAKTPKTVVIPLQQHIGAPAQPVVSVNDTVSVGQLIGKSSAFISANAHSSVTGVVVEIASMLRPSGDRASSVVIEAAEEQPAEQKKRIRDIADLNGEDIIEIVAESGIVGLGGAGFPAHVKLRPPKDKPIDHKTKSLVSEVNTLIINGAECEPYLTADHRLMLEKPDEIIEGALLVMKALNVKECFIGIEDNKPDVIKLFSGKLRYAESHCDEIGARLTGEPIKIVSIKTRYPQGAEKVLIKSITGREVPVGGLPMDVGVMVQNVGTTYAVFEGVILGKPLYERVVTVTGEVNNPKNLLVKIGTPISQLIEECGGYKEGAKRIIIGGPMMGMSIFTDEAPVIKTTTGILVLGDMPKMRSGLLSKLLSRRQTYPCISCGKCIDVCPMGLTPRIFPMMYKKGKFQEALAYGDILNCMECGCCDYECPSRISIVQSVRAIKSRLKREK